MKTKQLLSLFFVLFSMSISAQVLYQYVDGSANSYTITSDSISYKGVKASESSSGYYNGGKDKAKPIKVEEFKSLEKLLEKAFKAKKDQVKNREMMTGLLMKKKGSKVAQVILKSDAKSKLEIETYLNFLLESEK